MMGAVSGCTASQSRKPIPAAGSLEEPEPHRLSPGESADIWMAVSREVMAAQVPPGITVYPLLCAHHGGIKQQSVVRESHGYIREYLKSQLQAENVERMAAALVTRLGFQGSSVAGFRCQWDTLNIIFSLI